MKSTADQPIRIPAGRPRPSVACEPLSPASLALLTRIEENLAWLERPTPPTTMTAPELPKRGGRHERDGRQPQPQPGRPHPQAVAA